MTSLLDQAVERARNLSDAEQDGIAALILAEIDDETRWEEAFARSHSKLTTLSERAARQVAAGQCRTVGFDEL